MEVAWGLLQLRGALSALLRSAVPAAPPREEDQANPLAFLTGMQSISSNFQKIREVGSIFKNIQSDVYIFVFVYVTSVVLLTGLGHK
jgi:hypothetical protein